MLNDPEKIEEVRSLFESLSYSERARLYQFFSDVLAGSQAIAQIDFSDNTPDGTRQAPEVAGISVDMKTGEVTAGSLL